jgi:hypothetical protein
LIEYILITTRSPGVEPFYEKCGFDPEIVGWSGMGGHANPMAAVEGGNIYFKDPKR